MERLSLFLKNALNITKSELYKINEENRILVNGQPSSLQYKLKENDIVTVDDKEIKMPEYHYFLYNKPIGIICSNSKSIKESIQNYIDLKYRLFCVGRLDKLSHGLIILTNDGSFCHKILESDDISKEYIVKLEKVITDKEIKEMEKPIIIKGKTTLPAIVTRIDEKTIKVVLNDGKYHQIRLLAKAVDNNVYDLKRVRIGIFELDDLGEGKLKEIDIKKG